MARRRYSGTISVDVDVADVLSEVSDDDLREEAVARFGGAAIDGDLLADIEEQLLRHKPSAALALIDSFRRERAVTDGQRAQQYAQTLAEMRTVGAA